jgi:hypothetical protein
LVLVSPASIIPENVVTVSGHGFQPGEWIEVGVETPSSSADALTGTATADKEGSFYGVPITVTVSMPVGQYLVRAEGAESGRKAEVAFQVSGGGPYGSPSTYSGKGSSPVSFEGGGFKAGEIVALHFDSLAVDPLQQVIASAEGTVAISATVPLADPGEHAFFMVGEETNKPLRIPFSVVGFSPWASPTNYSPTAEQPIGFVGHDFAPGEEVRIFHGQMEGEPVAVTRADENGEFQLPDAHVLPVGAEGENLYVVTGVHSRSPVSITLEVLPFEPVLVLTTYAGQPGTVVSFTGSGFAPGETITAYLGGTLRGREVAKFEAGSDGTFEGAGAFTIPPDAKEGEVIISAVGERSKMPRDVGFAVLPLTPWAGLTAYAGPPGTKISFEGHGFLPGENVRIHLGDAEAPVLSTLQADEEGGFYGGGSYTVPDEAEGKINFTMVGETSETVTTAAFTVTAGGSEVPEETAPTSEEAVPTPVGGAAEQGGDS